MIALSRVVIIPFSTSVLSDKNLNNSAPDVSSKVTKESFSFENLPYSKLISFPVRFHSPSAFFSTI